MTSNCHGPVNVSMLVQLSRILRRLERFSRHPQEHGEISDNPPLAALPLARSFCGIHIRGYALKCVAQQ